MNSTPTPTPLIIRITKHLPLVEKFLLTGLAVGVILTLLKMDTSVTRLTLLGLGVTFFLSAYRPPEIPMQENEKFGFSELLGFMIVPKVLWISCAVSALGIAFYLGGNEGSKQMLFIGGSSIGIGTFLFLILLLNGVKHIKTVTPVLVRAVPLLLTDVYLFFK